MAAPPRDRDFLGTDTTGASALGWPLVERRKPNLEGAAPGDAQEELGRLDTVWTTPDISPFRWVAILVSVVVASPRLIQRESGLWIALFLVLGYATVRSIRPIRYESGRATTVALCLDAAIHTEIVLLTGVWASPYTFTLLPSILQGGFARGSRFAVKLALGIIVLISVPHLVNTQAFSQGLRDAAAWLAVLLLVAVLSGFARQVSRDSARQQSMALDRLNKLAEANALLLQLHRVTQTLPASLDLDGVLDSTVTRVGELMTFDHLTVLLFEESDRTWVPARRHGSRGARALAGAELPAPLMRARTSSRAVLETGLKDGGLAPDARSGLYASLRSRGSLIGLVAVESLEPDHFDTMDVQLLTGLVEPLGIAIDNARWFSRIRAIAADEERSRIARDLHDQIGQALAALGFGLDRAKRTAERGGDVVPVIDELRLDLRGAVKEVREALYDLRTEVSATSDLAKTLDVFLDRVADRSQIDVTLTTTVEADLPLPVQRELWWVAREAIANVEKHAKAEHLAVCWTVHPGRAELVITDDGTGFERGAGRPDSYGIIGMRERASSVGAMLRIDSAPGQGSTIRVTLGPDSGGRTP